MTPTYLISAEHREVPDGRYDYVSLTVPLDGGAITISGSRYVSDDSSALSIVLHGPRGGYWGAESFGLEDADALERALRVSATVSGQWGGFFTEPGRLGLMSTRGSGSWHEVTPRDRQNIALALRLVVADLETAIAEAGA